MCQRGVVAACTAPHTPGVGESGEGMCNMNSDYVLHLGITVYFCCKNIFVCSNMQYQENIFTQFYYC